MIARPRATSHAFERLYRAYVGDVYRYTLAVTGNAADAEDITQTTFMNAYRALERGEQPLKPRHWLIAIAHNVCRQRFRQDTRRPTQVAFEEDIAEALVPSEDTPSAADIQRALGQLALNQREAIIMRELEGRSYAEIAELLGLSMAAVETLIFRARRALREQLEGSLSCSEAEAALSLQLDGQLGRADAALLRSHLRACSVCRTLARRQRAQRKNLRRALAVVPLPPGLTSWLGSGAVGTSATGIAATAAGGGMTSLGAAVATKVAVATVAALAVGAGGYTIVQQETTAHQRQANPAAANSTLRGSAKTSPAGVGTSGHTSPARPASRAAGHGGRPAHGKGLTQSKGHAAAAAVAAGTRANHQPHTASSTHSQRAAGKEKATARRSVTAPAKKKTAPRLGGKHSPHAATPNRSARSCNNQATVATSTPPSPTTSATDVTTTTTTSPGSCPATNGHAKAVAHRP